MIEEQFKVFEDNLQKKFAASFNGHKIALFNAIQKLKKLPIHDVIGHSELLPKRLSNQAFHKAKELNYEQFVIWWDKQV